MPGNLRTFDCVAFLWDLLSSNVLADGGPLTDFYDSYVDYVPKHIVAQSHGRK